MKFFRDERAGAVFMLFAACLGFALVNLGVFDSQLGSIRLASWQYVSQISMALFFALIGFELRVEFSHGLFQNPRAILVPAFAAFVGVAVPAIVFIVFSVLFGANNEVTRAWPIVTATDVSFALMVFSLLAKGLPRTLRMFLLSFAVIDDMLATIALAIGFWRLDALTPLISTTTAIIIAFSLRPRQLTRVIKWLSPIVAFAVLPVFAFFAMQIKFDAQSVFLGAGAVLLPLLLTRPISKWIGVFAGAKLANRFVGDKVRLPISDADLFRVASLAGIGFTVSLLVADLAFGSESELYVSAATLTVIASVLAAGFAAIALRVRRVAK